MPSKQSPGRKVTKAEIAEWLMREDTEIAMPTLYGWSAASEVVPWWQHARTKQNAIRRAILAERQTRKGKG